MSDSVINRHALVVHGDYCNSIKRACQEILAHSQSISPGPTATRHREIMERFFAYLDSLSPQSRYLQALIRIQQAAGVRSIDRGWQPSTSQRGFLSLIGNASHDPSGPELLGELISLGIYDAMKSLNDRVRVGLEREREQVTHQVKSALDAEVSRARESEAQALHAAEAARQTIRQLKAERDQLAAIVDTLRAEPEHGEPEEIPDAPFQRRRTDVPGLYLSRRKSGIVLYEVKAGRNKPWRSFDERSEALEYLEEARAEKVAA